VSTEDIAASGMVKERGEKGRRRKGEERREKGEKGWE
jgi:hypothetical protein